MNDHSSATRTTRPESVALRALRFDMRSMLSIGALFVLVLVTWCIAEYATSVFRSNIENELRTVTASDISISSRTFPSDADRGELRSLAEKYKSKATESINFPFTLEIPAPAGSLSGSSFFTTEVRIVDSLYPLYGKIESSGSLVDGSLVDGELYEILRQSGFFVSGRNIPVGGLLYKAPGLSQNPFSNNRNIIVPKRLLPFETVTATGAGFRVEYRMDFSVPPENQKNFFAALEARFGKNATPSYRIRDQRGEGGNFSDIASTLNDFLGSILYASTIIALSSFLVAISRFALERRKNVKALLWMGLSEGRFVRVIFLRLIAFFGTIGLLCGAIFGIVTEVSFLLSIKGLTFLALGLTIGFWTISEILLRDTRLFQVHKRWIRLIFGGVLVGLLSAYLLLSGESYRPILYALASLILLERFSWGFFFLVSKFFSNSKFTSKSRFFLIDALRSFRNAPILGKISFSIFFLLSATLSAVFIFSLAFSDALKITAESRINTFVNNLLPKDFERLSTWIAPEEFYSTMRARIVTINGITLAEHLKTTEVSREFSREFSVTDTSTNDRIVSGKSVSTGKEVSVDEDFAQRLGLKIDDIIAFSLAGRNFEFRVVGIRESKRNGTTPFFYFQIPKDAIPGAPKTYFLATEVTGDKEAWKSKVIRETGNHVSFIDVGAIIEQARSYSRLVLQGVVVLFGYIATIGLLAFLTAEKSFFLLKIRKIQLYRILGCTKKEGFQLLFFESLLGNIVPVCVGSIAGAIGLIIFMGNNAILKITPMIVGLAFGGIALFFGIAYPYAKYAVRRHIQKTEPRIGGSEG